MRIFLLDDDASVTEVLKIIIRDKNLGTVCGVSHSALDALDVLEDAAPDIIITDLLMPEVDGITFVKKASKLCPEASFIMLSQVSDKEMVAKGYDAGVEFYIQKPVNGIEVIRVIENVARAQSMQRTIDSVQSLFAGAGNLGKQAPGESSGETDTSDYETRIKRILQKLGIIGERGSEDIIKIVCYFCEHESALSDMTIAEICAKYSDMPKSMEQRIRRAAASGLSNIAHMGLDDFGNEIFEEYSASLFRFEQVRKEMEYIKGNSSQHGNVQIRKFITALVNACMEA